MQLSPNNGPFVKQNLLHVVMHGLICLVDIGEKGYVAFMLDVGEVHEYKCGDWLDENPIPPRGLGQLPLIASLLGVDNSPLVPGENDLDTSSNVILSIKALPSLGDPRIRAVFNLPRPKNIYYFVGGAIPGGALRGTDLPQVKGSPSIITNVKVFEYLLSPNRSIYLASDPPDASILWTLQELSPTTNLDVAAASMHIYNEPPKPMNEDEGIKHGLDEFNESLDFFGLDINLAKPTTLNQSAPNFPPGLLLDEVTPLDKRNIIVRGLASAARANQAYRDGTGGGTGGQICSGAHATIT